MPLIAGFGVLIHTKSRRTEKCDEIHTLFMAQWGISNRAITYILIGRF